MILTKMFIRVQHAPGVVCAQDLSSLMAKAGKTVSMRPMLSHSPYPKTYARNPEEYQGGESDQYMKRYDMK